MREQNDVFVHRRTRLKCTWDSRLPLQDISVRRVYVCLPDIVVRGT